MACGQGALPQGDKCPPCTSCMVIHGDKVRGDKVRGVPRDFKAGEPRLSRLHEQGIGDVKFRDSTGIGKDQGSLLCASLVGRFLHQSLVWVNSKLDTVPGEVGFGGLDAVSMVTDLQQVWFEPVAGGSSPLAAYGQTPNFLATTREQKGQNVVV